MNIISAIRHLQSTPSYYQEPSAGPLQCIIAAINKIWASIVGFLQKIYSFLACSHRAEDDARVYPCMADFVAEVGRSAITGNCFKHVASYVLENPRLGRAHGELYRNFEEVRYFSWWTTHYFYHRGGLSNNPGKIFTLFNRLAEDLILNNLLADFCDLISTENTHLIDRALLIFLSTEETAPVIQAMRQIIPTRYAGFLPRYPMVFPEVDENFSRWDLLAVKRFHYWLNTIIDNTASLDVDLQRIMNSPFESSCAAYERKTKEIQCFAKLIHRLRRGNALDLFLRAAGSDPSVVRCVRFSRGQGYFTRSLFERLGIQLPIAFPIENERFTKEDALLVKRFRQWLCDTCPTPTTELNIESYLEGLDQEIATIRTSQDPDQPDQLARLEQRNLEYRHFASMIRYLRKCRDLLGNNGLLVFFNRLAYDELTVALLPRVIRKGKVDRFCGYMSRTYHGWFPTRDLYRGINNEDLIDSIGGFWFRIREEMNKR